jgi:hypothetical protein
MFFVFKIRVGGIPPTLKINYNSFGGIRVPIPIPY